MTCVESDAFKTAGCFYFWTDINLSTVSMNQEGSALCDSTIGGLGDSADNSATM